MTNDKYLVYLHRSPSQKYYVGITRRAPNKRWQNGLGYKTNQKFYRAIEKYGWRNFEHFVVAENLSELEARNLEMKLIEEYDALNNGYNQSPGGEKPQYPENAYKRMKEVLGKPVSQYTKNGVWINDYESMRDASKALGISYTGISGCISGRCKSAGGYLWTLKGMPVPEVYKRRRETHRVFQISPNDAKIIGMFDSIKEASDYNGIPYASLRAACSNNHYFAHGYYWASEKQLHEKLGTIKNKIKFGTSRRCILCVTTNENFYNINEAAEYYDLSPSGISACCTGKTRYCGIHPVSGEKLVWRYLN